MKGEKQANRKLSYLLLGLGAASLLIIFQGVIFKQKPIPMEEITIPLSEIKINFEVLDSQELKDLLPFETTTLPSSIGRENPFSAY